MKLSTAGKIVKGQLKGCNVEFSSVSIDTRTMMPGALFVALIGEHSDGHQFIEYAQQAKAVAALVSTPRHQIDFPQLIVEDSARALIALASFWRKQFHIPIVGVTGSCGKTTVKSLCESIFKEQASVLVNEKSFNNTLGVPLTLLRLQSHHQYAILEIGANHPGEIRSLCNIVKPKVAIITNAGAAHLEGFGNLDGVARAKGEIIESLPDSGTVVINLDSPYKNYWQKIAGKRRIITFSTQTLADIIARDIQLNSQGEVQFFLQLPNNAHADIKLPLLGKHNVHNALAAVAAAYSQKIPMVSIKAGLETIKPATQRLVEYQGLFGAQIIDDTYNANPLSLNAAIELLSHRAGRLILVLGDMVELGKKSILFHREAGKKAKALGIDYLFSYGELSAHSMKTFGKNAWHFNDQIDLIEHLKKQLDSNTTILVKGSNSMKMNNIITKLTEV